MRRSVLLDTTAALTVLALATGCDDLSRPNPNQVDGGGGSGANAGIPIDVSGPDQIISQGQILPMFGGQVTSWAVLDPSTKKLKAFKWTLPLTTVTGVPESTSADLRYWLKLPDELTSQTVFTATSVDFLPHGHVPVGVYDTPHWEFHLLTLPYEEALNIDCSDPKMPPDTLLPTTPPGWFAIPPPDNCVPGMGIHAVTPLLPEFQKQKFTKSCLPVYYHGKFASIEPKATREFLLQRQSFSLEVPRVPASHAALYPGSLTVTYDKPTDTYVWAFQDFTDASVVAQ